MSKELEKAYEPSRYEDGIYAAEEQSGFFNSDTCVEKGVCKKNAQPFSIVLPPPNVTGTLHMGHAVMLAIEDVMIRYHRMKGDRTLWVPGTDHAAIATQSKVERIILEKEGVTRQQLGKHNFLECVARFVKESQNTIKHQTRKMGASMQWASDTEAGKQSREAFTLDATREKAVRTVFKMMYDDGIIYRDSRMVNWSVGAQSVLSDDELEWEDRQEPFYYIRCGEFVIGTVRPETKNADSPLVVHPKGSYVRLHFKDKKGQEDHIIISKNLFGNKEQLASVLNALESQGELEVVETMKGKDLEGQEFEYETYAGMRKFFVLADEVIDMEKGTGAMTISAAHSADDYDLAKRRGLDKYFFVKITPQGTMTECAGVLAGQTIEVARKEAATLMTEKGLIVGVDKKYTHRVPLCYRSHTVVEPMISKQWFVDVNKKFAVKGNGIKNVKEGQKKTLKELMQTVVKSGQIKILPARFEKTYFHWIDNLRDWCVSRQIWYGHQIPVWFCDNKKCKAHDEEPAAVGESTSCCPHCAGIDFRQDPDTLDTWFSSGLWTFSTLAHKPQDIVLKNGHLKINTDDFKNFHPTSVLETGYDILFFWVARMILMATYALGQIPFQTVYLHGLVRDEQGRKMSKSLDNIIDPLDMVKKYGADATRLSLLIGASPGNDSRLSEEKIANFCHFTNKLWNISRFVLLNIDEPKVDVKRPQPRTVADKWILELLNDVIIKTTGDIEKFNISVAGERLREFTWNELADWYLEIAKIEGNKSAMLNYILNTLLKLWHPYLPFVTEAVWREVYGNDKLLLVETWPVSIVTKKDKAGAQFELLKKVITGIRTIRTDYKVSPQMRLQVMVSAGKEAEFFVSNSAIVEALGRVEKFEIQKIATKPVHAASFVAGGVEVFVKLENVVDFEKEKIRLQKEIASVEPYVKGLEKKLSNKEFVRNAPAEVVAKEQQKLQEAQEKLVKLQAQLTQLK